MIKHVLYCGLFELPDKNAAAHRVTGVAKALALCAVKTTFLSASHGVTEPKKGDGEFSTYFEPYPSDKKSWLKYMSSTENIEKVLDEEKDIDALILYNPTYSLAKAAKKTAKKRNIAFFCDITEWNADTSGSAVKRLIKKADWLIGKRNIPRLCDGMIVISTLMQSYYGKFGFPVLLLPPMNDVDDEKWHGDGLTDDGGLRLCFAGTGGGSKDSLDSLINAVGRVEEYTLSVIGTNENELKKMYPNLNVPKNVVLHGRVDHKTALRYVIGADYYVFIRENSLRNNAGFPTKFTEAYTCGVPIITTESSDIVKYLKEENAGVVLPSTSVDDIEKCLKNLLAHPMRHSPIRRTFDYREYQSRCEEWLKLL